jgi:hypothetical protein
MQVRIVGSISFQETIAVGRSTREVRRLRRKYGLGQWKERKGMARVQLVGGDVRHAEIHWYEAARISRREFKIKHFIDVP